MYFPPATQGKEVEEDDTDQPEYMGSCKEDDILYAGGAETVVEDATTLLFIHQSEQQLEILKRWPKANLKKSTNNNCIKGSSFI